MENVFYPFLHGYTVRCASCNSGSLQYLNYRDKKGTKVDLYKCSDCKKYFLKQGINFVLQPDAPSPGPRVQPKTPIQSPVAAAIVAAVTCEICRGSIGEDRLKRGSTTCGKECAAIHSQRKKDEYHRLRKLKLQEKKNDPVGSRPYREGTMSPVDGSRWVDPVASSRKA